MFFLYINSQRMNRGQNHLSMVSVADKYIDDPRPDPNGLGSSMTEDGYNFG
jgi:hypothetical protein